MNKNRADRLAELRALGACSSIRLDAICRAAAALAEESAALLVAGYDDGAVVIGSCGALAQSAPLQHPAFDRLLRTRSVRSLISPDVTKDPSLSRSDLTIDGSAMRFFAGVSSSWEGERFALCLVAEEARSEFDARQTSALEDLLRVVISQIDLHRASSRRATQKRRVEHLEASLDRHRMLLRDAVGTQKRAESIACFGLWRVDPQSWTVTWSDGLAKIMGRPQPENGIVGLDLHISYYHPEDQPKILARIESALNSHPAQDEGAYRSGGRLMRPSGEERDVIVEGYIERDDSGRVVALQGVTLDITDLIRSERRVTETETFLRTTLENMDQGLLMLGPDERVRIHNRRFTDLLGLPTDLVRPGLPYSDIRSAVEKSGRIVPDFAPVTLERKPDIRERRCTDGSLIEVRAVPLPDGGVVRTYSDVTDRRRVQNVIEESERKYRLLAENSIDVIIWSDLDTTRRYVSPVVKRVLGYEPEELVGTRPLDFVHGDDIATYRRSLEDISAAKVEQIVVCSRYRHKTGRWVWIEASFRLARDAETGCPTGLVASLRDVNDRKAVEDALRLSEERLALALESGNDNVWEWDIAAKIMHSTHGWSERLGYGKDEFDSTISAWRDLIHPDDLGRVRKLLKEHLEAHSPRFECEYRLRTGTGEYLWTLARGKVVQRDEHGRPLRMMGTNIDINERKKAERLIAHMATHDPLTGLANRTLFRERVSTAIRHAHRHSKVCAILACDLDRFKAINDMFGHATGDAVLSEVGKRLKAATRDSDTVARLGGDEFAMLIVGMERVQDAKSAAERVIEAIGLPMEVEGRSIDLGVSIGIAIGPTDGTDADQLHRSADLAMYRAKQAGRNTQCLYEAAMDVAVAERNMLEQDLRKAVRGGDLELHYQPITKIADSTISCFEALLRWRHPTRGMVAPAEFIPLAEDTGLITSIGDWALRAACREAAGWPDKVRVAVNVSAVQFRQPERLVQSVLVALGSSRLPADRLELEITESVLIGDAEAVIGCLHALRQLGVRIALDDFGTGYSSLSYLRRFPFDKIKIDRTFVREIDDPETAAIVRAVVGLAERAGADITAEGVETEEQLLRIGQEGCTEAQGFLLNRPMPAGDALQLACARRAA